MHDDDMAHLKGSICLDKRLRRHPVWNREPASYGQAWVDLLLTAVDEKSAPQTIWVNGAAVVLQRGQVGRSFERLAEDWKRSKNWVIAFLEWCKDETMITIQSNRRTGTIITILNYDAYQLQPGLGTTESTTEGDTVESTDGTTESTTEGAYKGKGEKEKGNRKGERGRPGMIPDDREVADFCAAFVDVARGIQGIPEVWWRGWLGARLSARQFPADWPRALTHAFVADWIARHPKALAASGCLDSAQPHASVGKNEKNAAAGRTPAQARFELSRELEALRERLDAAYDLGQPADESDRQREREIVAQLKALGGGQ